MAQDGGKVVSVTHRPLFTPQEILLVLISLRGWVDPRAIVRSEGLCQWKIAMTPSGTEPATFRFVGRTLTTVLPRSQVDMGAVQYCNKFLKGRFINDFYANVWWHSISFMNLSEFSSSVRSMSCLTGCIPSKPNVKRDKHLKNLRVLKTLFPTTSVLTVNSISLWPLCFISLRSSLFMKDHMLYNKIVYCYDVAIYFPARIHRTYFCAMLSVHYLSSCARCPLSWQILIIPKATKKSIYTTFLPSTAPILCDICY